MGKKQRKRNNKSPEQIISFQGLNFKKKNQDCQNTNICKKIE